MTLRIAFDLDGVLADLEGRLAREAERLQTREPRESSKPGEPGPRPRLDWTKPDLWHHVQAIENFWEQLDEVEPGGLEAVSAVAQARRWETIFLTSRPECAGATAQIQTQRWLLSHGFLFPNVYVVHASRGRIAAALRLDVVVDDHPGNCIDVATNSRARSLLMWRRPSPPPAATARYEIGVVGSIAECLQALTTPERRADESRLAVRLRRFFSFRALRRNFD